jgi:uncharacterized protein (TIGR02145 family)
MQVKIFLFAILIAPIAYGQSKKEIIENLTNLNSKLMFDLNQKEIDIKKLNQKEEEYRLQIEKLTNQVESLNNSLSSTKKELSIANNDNEKNKALINALSSSIQQKNDSLNLLLKEIEALKPKSIVTPVTSSPVQNGPYKTVNIGKQVWMTQNLNVSTFRNGDPIQEAKSAQEWKAAYDNKEPAWCYYDNDPKNGNKYGKLYNYYAVSDPRGVAPTGFHIPSVSEFKELEEYSEYNDKYAYLLGSISSNLRSKSGWGMQSALCSNCKNASSEYQKICPKCKGTKYYGEENAGGSNKTGFSALPSGYRHRWGSDIRFEGGLNGEYRHANFWSSDPGYMTIDTQAVFIDLTNGYNEYYYGYSIRCIKD